MVESAERFGRVGAYTMDIFCIIFKCIKTIFFNVVPCEMRHDLMKLVCVNIRDKTLGYISYAWKSILSKSLKKYITNLTFHYFKKAPKYIFY